MMMGLGFWVMLIIISVPILLLVSLLLLLVKPIMSRAGIVWDSLSVTTLAEARPGPCSRCGAMLQPEWLHCPQCGAPSGGESVGRR